MKKSDVKKILIRIGGCALAVCLLAVSLVLCTSLLERKDSREKYAKFFEHASDMDVLFLGTSHVLNSVFPMELWNDYGITSYNMGGHANQIPTSYWVMMNAFDYASPKVVVIDCYSLASNLKVFDDFEFVHLSFDAFPVSKTKIKAVNDLLYNPGNDNSAGVTGENGTKEKHTRLGLLWDYSVYHSRWSDMKQEDFEPVYNKEYGAESRIQIAEPSTPAENPGTTLEEMTVGRAYLELMIEECQKRGIDVLLTYIPYPVTGESTWVDINTVSEIAKQHGVKYLNYLDLDVVDYETDCYDPASHLNPSGAFKVTDQMGQYLMDNYSLTDHRGDEAYAYWDMDFAGYTEMKDERLEEQGDLNTYLMLLQDKRYDFEIETSDSEILEDETTKRLLEKKGIVPEAGPEDEAVVRVFEKGKDGNMIDESRFAIQRVSYDAEGQTLRTSRAVRIPDEDEEKE